MKTIGIVGGTGPDSTAEYYRALVALSRERLGDGIPRILVNSLDGDRAAELFGFVGGGRHDELAAALVDEVALLATAGADLALLASNTLHVVFDEVGAGSPIPLISIVEAACMAAVEQGVHRPALLATTFTVQADLYRPVFGPRGIDVMHPGTADQHLIHDIYVRELLHAQFVPQSRDALLGVVARMQAEQRIDGVILGGTELPLLLTGARWHGIPFLDTGRLHAAAALDAAVRST